MRVHPDGHNASGLMSQLFLGGKNLHFSKMLVATTRTHHHFSKKLFAFAVAAQPQRMGGQNEAESHLG